LIAANTDVAHLINKCIAPNKIQIGVECTEGLGAGGDPDKGRQAAEESMPTLIEILGDSHITFVTAGLGGGTGTGAAPAVVEALTKLKKPPLVVSVVVLPFDHEQDRPEKAKPAMEALLAHSNSLICISNAKLMEIMPDNSCKECWAMADQVLYRAVSCITDLILNPGEIHLDFADIRTALSAKGLAVMGIGEASGEGRGLRAVQMAINSPLMENQSINGAKYLLINIIADDELKIREFKEINEFLVNQAAPNVKVFSGLTYDNDLRESGLLKVTVIATGLDPNAGAKNRPEKLEDDEAPITLEVEAEPHITLSSDPVQQQQPEVQQPRRVRLKSIPVARLASTNSGYNKYETNSVADPLNLSSKGLLYRSTTPANQRTVQQSVNRGVDEARSIQQPSYMINKAD
jgi:cell division protein FtsZ